MKKDYFSIQNNKGFTLIELLVVIIIIGVLATISIVYIDPAEYVKRGNDAKRMNDLNLIEAAISRALAESKITFSASAISNMPKGSTSMNVANTDLVTTGTGWVRFTPVAPGFNLGDTQRLPFDPKNSGGNYYRFCANAGKYKISTKLEAAQNLALMSQDGDSYNSTYSVGNDLTIDCEL